MRIVIGEDSALFREGLAQLLISAGHEVPAKASDAPSVVAAVEAELPDLVIIDIRMPPGLDDDGARAARDLRGRHPGLPIVLLSQHVETRHSVELVGTGAFGYLLKDRVLDVDEFMDALRRVAAGGSALDPEVVSRLIGRGRPAQPPRLPDDQRTGGAGPDGGGPHEPGDRPPAVAERPHRGKPRRQHPDQARHHRKSR